MADSTDSLKKRRYVARKRVRDTKGGQLFEGRGSANYADWRRKTLPISRGQRPGKPEVGQHGTIFKGRDDTLSPAQAQKLNKQWRAPVKGGLLERTQSRAKRLGVDLGENVTRAQAARLRQRLVDEREKNQPYAVGKPAARGTNVVESGRGSSRKGQRYRVQYNPQTSRYEHVYGKGKEAERIALRSANPLTQTYHEQYGTGRPTPPRKKRPGKPQVGQHGVIYK